MNYKSAFGIITICLLSLTSCKKELEPQESTTSADTATVAAPDAVEAQATVEMPVETQPEMQNQQAIKMSTPAPAAVAKGMNPAHGQPGHRCDIAVGAPLNSPKKAATPATPASQPGSAVINQVPTPQPQATPSILNPATATTATAPGMNPPHGQPGHRCDVSVGAPLPN